MGRLLFFWHLARMAGAPFGKPTLTEVGFLFFL